MLARISYETRDITPYLRPGANVVAVCLCAGWYFQNERVEDISFSYDTPRFIAQLEFRLGSGQRRVIASDARWKCGTGPLTVRRTCTINAKVFLGNHPPSPTAQSIIFFCGPGG